MHQNSLYQARTLGALLTCVLIFLLAWYDTVNAHVLTQFINTWIVEYVYVPLELTGQRLFYYNSLESLTALGTDIILLLMLGVIFADLIAKQQYKILLYCIIAILIIFACTQVCKQFIYSPRPLFPGEHDSFPSGHTVRVGIWCGIILLLNLLKIYRLPYAWHFLLWLTPLLVAYTRLGLGRHWLSDVIASLVLCSAVFLATWYVIKISKKPNRL